MNANKLMELRMRIDILVHELHITELELEQDKPRQSKRLRGIRLDLVQMKDDLRDKG